VHLGHTTITFHDAETILTEYSHKYTVNRFAAMAGLAGFTVNKVWSDPDQWFSVQLLLRD
jgi:uncharacterized SAM-dependent methyltransferase